MSESGRPLPPFPPREARDQKVAVLGVGNELDGDDAVGVLVVRELKSLVEGSAPACAPSFLILEVGLAPENFTGKVRKFAPDLVILVDAAEFKEAPGYVEWLDWRDAQGFSASTHSLPPTLLAQYLIHELGCRVILVGVQPQQLIFDEPVSPAVQAVVQPLSRGLAAWLLEER